MLFGDAYVKSALRELFQYFINTRAVGHSSGEGDDFFILSHQFAHRFAQDSRISRRFGGRFDSRAGVHIKRAGGVPGVIILFAGRVALAFSGNGMDDNRPVVNLLRLAQSRNQGAHVMAVHIADVFEAEFIDQCARQNGGGNGIFESLGGAAQSSAKARNGFELIADFFFETVVTLCAAYAVEITRKRADGGRDRHFVIVQQHDEPRFQVSRLVNGFHRHAASQTGITDERADVVFFALLVTRNCHTQRGRQRGRSVARAKGVVFRFVTLEKTAQTAVLLHGVEAVTASGQNLVGVGLVAHVPDQAVLRRLESVVQGNG